MAGAAPVLRIGRLANRYLLPRVGTGPAVALRARLERVASQHLAEALDGLVAAVPEAGGEEVWLIRHLHVDVAIGTDLTASPGVLARAWSQRLLLAVRQALAGGDAEVVRFPSEAAWTARFAAEVAAGTAWDRWYLRAFSSLRVLPAGRAIAEAIAREPRQAGAVLADLWRSGQLEAVLRACGAGDARRVVEAVVPAGAAGGAAGRSLARELARSGAALRPPHDPHLPGSVLRVLAAASACGVPLGPGAAGVAGAVVVLADLVAGAADPGLLAGAVVGRRWVEALGEGGRDPRSLTRDEVAALEVLARLAGDDVGWLAGLASQVAPGVMVPAGAPDGDAPVVTTAFGGLLLLWPLFVECWPLEPRGSEVAPPPPSDDPVRVPSLRLAPGGDLASLHRFAVAAQLLGRANLAALLRDPVLALLCGLNRPPVPARLAEARWSLPVDALAAVDLPGQELSGEPADTADAAGARFCALVLRRFAARLPGFAASSPGYLLRNFLAVPATVSLGAETWHAELAPPPLQVVLRMAGLSTTRTRLPWPPAAEVVTALGVS